MNVQDLYQQIKAIETGFGSVERINRNEYVSIALGAIAASCAPLPTSPVNNPTNHYLLQHESTIKTMFSELNELYVFNLQLAVKVARQVYLARYRRVYDKDLILGELALIMPNHVSKMPEEVERVFAELTEEQKHSFAMNLIPVVSGMLGFED